MQKKFNEDLKRKIFYSVFIGFIFINALLLVSMRLLPFIDLPQHLAYATIYKHIGESGNAFNQYFEFDSMLLKFNTLHPIFCSLDLWGNVEVANKIFFVLYIILQPVSMFLLIKKLHGNYWMALLSFLFLYNFNVSWGFVGFSMAIPFCFLALTYQYEYLTTHSLKSIFLLSLFLVIIYHLHLLSALFILGLILLQHLFFNRKSLKEIFLKGLIYLPLICLILWGIVIRSQGGSGNEADQSLIARILDYYKDKYLFSIKYRLGGIFFWDNFFIFKGIKGILIGTLFSFFSIGCLFWPFKSKIKSLISNIMEKRKLFALSIFIYSLLVYLFIFSNGLMYFRFSVFVFLSLIIVGSLLLNNKVLKTIHLLIPIICIFYIIFWGDYFIKFQQENKPFNKTFFKDIPKDKVLSGLIYEPTYRGWNIYIHFPDYYITWHHGIETSHIINSYPNYRLKRKISYEKLPHSHEWISKTKNYQGNFDNMDYLLIKGVYPPDDGEKIIRNFNVMKKRGDWILMTNKHNIK